MIGYSAFTDESGTSERFLCFGGVFLPTGLIDEAEFVLDAYCQRRGFAQREVSWKKCSKAEVDRYSGFAELFWEIDCSICTIDFRALVVDTHTYPLRDPATGCNTDEDGFYKFYHFFISRSFELVGGQADEFEVVAAPLADAYCFRTEILTNTVAGALRAAADGRYRVTEIQRDSPRVRRLHQLSDVLLGAVSFRFNRYDGAAHKAPICHKIEQKVGQSLEGEFYHADRPFNVWRFIAKEDLRR